MSGSFGLQPLLGKTLAIIGDARLSARADQTVIVEHLLALVGQDPIEVYRKNKPTVTAAPSARIVLVSNDLPSLQDPALAMAGRMLLLNMARSFSGQEDIEHDPGRKLPRDGIIEEVESCLPLQLADHVVRNARLGASLRVAAAGYTENRTLPGMMLIRGDEGQGPCRPENVARYHPWRRRRTSCLFQAIPTTGRWWPKQSKGCSRALGSTSKT
ncbi:MAG: hypothetical protein RIT81_09865 [Deltaproteobacteria bacterium]